MEEAESDKLRKQGLVRDGVNNTFFMVTCTPSVLTATENEIL